MVLKYRLVVVANRKLGAWCNLEGVREACVVRVVAKSSNEDAQLVEFVEAFHLSAHHQRVGRVEDCYRVSEVMEGIIVVWVERRESQEEDEHFLSVDVEVGEKVQWVKYPKHEAELLREVAIVG